VREVRPPEMHVAQRDEPGHYSANPFDAPAGRSATGCGLDTDFR
jgi:hypothetical protein